MKKIYTFIKKSKITLLYLPLMLLFATTSNAQFTTVEIGAGSTTVSQGIPIEPYYGYTYSQQIYTAAELTAAGLVAGSELKDMRFEYSSTTLTSSNNWEVYIGHTSKSSFSSTSDWEVFLDPYFMGTATVTTSTSPYQVIIAGNQIPFIWDGVRNVVIGVDENAPGYGSSTNDFYCRSATSRALTYYSDWTNPDPNMPPSMYLRSYVPNIFFTASNVNPGGGGGGGCSGSHSNTSDLSVNNVSGSAGTSYCSPNSSISTFPYLIDFETTIGCEWCFNSTDGRGRIRTYTVSGDNALMMDCSSSGGNVENTATLALDLSGHAGSVVTLDFDWSDHGDESGNYDRVQVSTNGGTSWYTCASTIASGSSTSQQPYPTIILSALPGFTYSSNYLIKFSQYDNYPYASDGLAFDNIAVTATCSNSWTGAVNTAWTNTGNWSCGTVPGAADYVTIPNVANQPVVSSAVSITELTINSGADLTVASGTLSVSGATDVNGTLIIGSGGTYDANGSFTAGGAVIDFTGAGFLQLGSTVASLGTLDQNVGTVVYDGTTQTVLNDNYYNLTLNASGTKTFATALLNNNVYGNLTVGSGCTFNYNNRTLVVAGSTDINGTVTGSTGTLDCNGNFDATGGNVTFTGAGTLKIGATVTSTSTSLGTLSTDNGTVEYDGGAITIVSDTYNNLKMSQSNTKGTAGNITVNGDHTVLSGCTYDAETYITTVSGTSDIDGTLAISTGTYNADGTFDATNGTVDFSAAGKLILSSSVTSLGTLDESIGTVEYDATAGSAEIDNEGIGSGNYSSSYNYPTTTPGGFWNCQATGDNGNWYGESNSVGSGSGNTGPIAPHTGDDYIYCETSSGHNLYYSGEYAYLESNAITQSGVSLSFYYYMFGAQVGVLSVESYNGSTWTQRWSLSGQQQTSSGLAWIQASVDMSAYTVTKLRFKYRKTLNGWKGDVALDDIVVSYSTTVPPVLADTYNNLEIDCVAPTVVGTIDIKGNLTVNNGKTLDMGSNALSIGGNITNNGTLTLTSNTTTFDGSSAQYINNNTTFNNLTLNNSAGLELVAPINVNGTLTLTDGHLTSDATYKLTVKAGGSVDLSSCGSSTHVIGPMDHESVATSEIILPVGDGTRFRPVFVSPVSTSATTWSAEFKNTPYNGGTNCTNNLGLLDHVAPFMHWDVDNNGGANGTVGLSWNPEILVDAPADMRLAHWNGNSWEKVGDILTGSNGSGSATGPDGRVSGLMTSFSPVNLGSSSGNGNPLPIDLVSFNANCSHDIVDVSFSVVSQINNDYFLIERSEDAMEWEEVGRIDGAGNSNSLMDYSLVDNAPNNGLSYYRLTQVDYDGGSKTFSPVSSSCEEIVGSGLPVEVYPNPMINEITIEMDLEEYQGKDVYYTILDARGSIVKTDYLELSRGFNKHKIGVQDLPNGVYILRFNNTRDHISEQRIVKR